MTKHYVSYIRVSTQRQGISGLGLEAQQAAVARHITDGQLIAEYREIETGKSKKHGKRVRRPEFDKAVDHAKRTGATLLVAKLDRLARSVYVTSALMESGVEFAACDIPYANKLTVHVMAAFAESEADAISQRTKAALAAAKARGTLLGAANPENALRSPEKATKYQRNGSKANQTAAVEAYSAVLPVMIEWREAGLSLPAIAQRMNAMGQKTRTGKPWSAVQVMRVLDRVAS